MSVSTRRSVLAALAAAFPTVALANAHGPAGLDPSPGIAVATLPNGAILRVTRTPDKLRRPALLICGAETSGRFAAECAAAGFVAAETFGGPSAIHGALEALDWLASDRGGGIDSSRIMVGAEGAEAARALALAAEVMASGQGVLAGVVGLDGEYDPASAVTARRLADPARAGRQASLLLFSHPERAASTLELGMALFAAGTPFQMQILADDTGSVLSRPAPNRRALSLAQVFAGQGEPAAPRA